MPTNGTTTFVATLIFALAGIALGQSNPTNPPPVDDVGKAHYFKAFAGQSILILGTEDRRHMAGLEYGYGRPDKRLAANHYPAQLVCELKVDYSRASGDFPRDRTFDLALGAIFYAHYELPCGGSRGWCFDWGGGLESVDTVSHDLPQSLNGAIMLGAGFYIPQSSHRILVGIRYFHISNADRSNPDFGQNQVQLTVGIKY